MVRIHSGLPFFYPLFMRISRYLMGCAPSLLLAPDDDDHESAGFGCRASSWFRFLKLSCGQIDLVLVRVNVHCFGAYRSSHYLLGVELAGRSVAGNVKLAVAATRERLMTVEFRSIDAGSDWQVSDHLAIVRAHYDHLLLIATSDKKPMLPWVDREPHGCPTGSDRPVRQYFSCFKVHDGYLILVFQIDEDLASAISGEELGFAAQCNIRIERSGFRIEIGLERHQDAIVA